MAGSEGLGLHTPEAVAAVAKKRAAQARAEAVRWWVSEVDPTMLHVLAEMRLQSGRVIVMHLHAALGEP